MNCYACYLLCLLHYKPLLLSFEQTEDQMLKVKWMHGSLHVCMTTAVLLFDPLPAIVISQATPHIESADDGRRLEKILYWVVCELFSPGYC